MQDSKLYQTGPMLYKSFFSLVFFFTIDAKNETLKEYQPPTFSNPSTTQYLSFPPTDKPYFRLAFGSCYGLLDYRTDVFKHVNNQSPQLWMWLGDAAYTDDIYGSSCNS